MKTDKISKKRAKKSSLKAQQSLPPTDSGRKSELKVLLAELSSRSRVDPRVRMHDMKPEIRDSTCEASDKTSASTSTSLRGSAQGGVVWAKGTGFGANTITASYFDPNQHSSDQQRQDHELSRLLVRLTALLPVECAEQDRCIEAGIIGPSPASSLGFSCLLPFLARLLGNDSVLDMGRHSALYAAVFDLIGLMAASPHLRSLLLGPVSLDAGREGETLAALAGALYDRVLAYWRGQERSGQLGDGAADAVVRTHLEGRVALPNPNPNQPNTAASTTVTGGLR